LAPIFCFVFVFFFVFFARYKQLVASLIAKLRVEQEGQGEDAKQIKAERQR
jgi:hypothetical protein